VVAGWFTPDWAAARPKVVEQTIKMIRGYSGRWPRRVLHGHRLLGRSPVARPDQHAHAGDRRFAGFGDTCQSACQTLAAAIYRAKLEVLDGAHLAILEQADKANRLITRHAAAR